MAKMYFLGFVAPAEINAEVLKWKQLMKERYQSVVALRSPAHITLVAPFWMEESLEIELRNVLDQFSAAAVPFQIKLKDFGAFKPRVIYVDIEPNDQLGKAQRELNTCVADANYFRVLIESRPFYPHITIATRDLRKKAFYEAWDFFAGRNYEATWIADGISILRHGEKNWDVIYTSEFQRTKKM